MAYSSEAFKRIMDKKCFVSVPYFFKPSMLLSIHYNNNNNHHYLLAGTRSFLSNGLRTSFSLSEIATANDWQLIEVQVPSSWVKFCCHTPYIFSRSNVSAQRILQLCSNDVIVLCLYLYNVVLLFCQMTDWLTDWHHELRSVLWSQKSPVVRKFLRFFLSGRFFTAYERFSHWCL